MSTHLEELLRRARAKSDERTNANVAYISRVQSRQMRALVAELADALQGFLIGPAECLMCGQRVEPGDQAYHLRSAHLGPHVFFFDGRKYSTDRPSMMVWELKKFVMCTSTYQLYEEREGDPTDKARFDGEAVDLTRRPHFFNVPPATM